MAYRFFRNWLVASHIVMFAALVSACSGSDPEVSTEVEVPQVGSDNECRASENCTVVDDEPALATVFRTHSGQFIQNINTQVRGVIEYQQSLSFVYVPTSDQRVAFVLDSYSQDEVDLLSIPDRESDFDEEYLNDRPDLDLTVQSTERGNDLLRVAASRSKNEAFVLDLVKDVQYEITVSAWDRDYGTTASELRTIGAFNLKIVDANRESLGMTSDEVLVDYTCVDRLLCRSSLTNTQLEFYEQFEQENSLAAPTDEQDEFDQIIAQLLETKFQLIINRRNGEVRRYRTDNNLGYLIRGNGEASLERDRSTPDYKMLEDQRIAFVSGGEPYTLSYSLDFEGSYEGSTFLLFAGRLVYNSRVLIP